jgi:hypothetical protein
MERHPMGRHPMRRNRMGRQPVRRNRMGRQPVIEMSFCTENCEGVYLLLTSEVD